MLGTATKHQVPPAMSRCTAAFSISASLPLHCHCTLDLYQGALSDTEMLLLCRRELQRQIEQQTVATARRQLAAGRIGRAWRRYRSSPAFAARLHAVLCLQAHVRGLLARRLSLKLRCDRALLASLHAAVDAGSLEAVRQAEAAAAAAGLKAQAADIVGSFQARVKATMWGLQQAAAQGSAAEFEAAKAAACKFAHLQQLVVECGAVLSKRQAALEQALQVAAAGGAHRCAAAISWLCLCCHMSCGVQRAQHPRLLLAP